MAMESFQQNNPIEKPEQNLDHIDVPDIKPPYRKGDRFQLSDRTEK